MKGLFGIWQIFYPTLANFIFYLANFKWCSKWPSIEKVILSSGHTVLEAILDNSKTSLFLDSIKSVNNCGLKTKVEAIINKNVFKHLNCIKLANPGFFFIILSPLYSQQMYLQLKLPMNGFELHISAQNKLLC